jgi:uncharacterized protein (DUF4415 family)
MSRRHLSPETSAVIAAGIELHVGALAACRGQAQEIFKLQKNAAEDTEDGDEELDLADPLGLSTQRAIHELEAAVHASALTSIGLTLANLDAQGIEVRPLVSVQLDADVLERFRETTGADPEGRKPQ